MERKHYVTRQGRGGLRPILVTFNSS
jgi:hypothetical protein